MFIKMLSDKRSPDHDFDGFLIEQHNAEEETAVSFYW